MAQHSKPEGIGARFDRCAARLKAAMEEHRAAKLEFEEISKELLGEHISSFLGEANLTRREREVLQLVVEGKANKEVGNALNISERTVKFHVASLLSKYKAQSRIDLIRARFREPHVTETPAP